MQRLVQTLESRHLIFVVAALPLLLGAVARLRRRSSEAYKRGVVVLSSRSALRGPRTSLRLAGCPVPFLDETKHFKMIGTTGTGKSTAIRELLEGALARGDRAVFADPDGGYRDCFFRRFRGDIVLNPFEEESVK